MSPKEIKDSLFCPMKKYGINVLASLLIKELVDEGRLQDAMVQIDGTEKTLSQDTGFSLEIQSPLMTNV